MANNLSSNVTEDLLRMFLKKFESDVVMCKTVDRAILDGKVNEKTGGTVSVKRPHQYNSLRTAGGDISSSTKSNILSGKATGDVQNYITVATEWTDYQESLQLDQLKEIIDPMAERAVIDLETSLVDYMIKHSALSYGTPGTAVDAWTDIGGAMALLKSIGVPSVSGCYYVMPPFTAMSLASAQTGLSADPARLVQTAWEQSQISSNFAGLKVITSNALSTWTRGTSADSAGALSATPTQTYVAAKDTMQQTWSLTGFSANATVKAGDILEVTGKYHVNLKTRKTVINNGTPVKFRAVVTADVTLDASGEGDVVVENAAIYESAGQYNNISAALASGDVVTLLGASATEFQPSHFYHPQAFGLTTVKLSKLFATDTVSVSDNGFQVRCTKYADGDANEQKIRFDILPVFATFNPLFAGKGFGV